MTSFPLPPVGRSAAIAVEDVGAAGPLQPVDFIIAVERVGEIGPEHVLDAAQRVGTGTAGRGAVAQVDHDPGAPDTAEVVGRVDATLADQLVVAGAAFKSVVAGAAFEPVVAAEALDHVVAARAVEDVVAVRCRSAYRRTASRRALDAGQRVGAARRRYAVAGREVDRQPQRSRRGSRPCRCRRPRSACPQPRPPLRRSLPSLTVEGVVALALPSS